MRKKAVLAAKHYERCGHSKGLKNALISKKITAKRTENIKN